MVAATIALGFAAVISVIAVCWFILRRRRRPQFPPWIEPQKQEMDDPTLGRCVITLPVVGQNFSRGGVECVVNIDSDPCLFRDDFFDESGGTAGHEEALERIRHFRKLICDTENLKRFRNSLVEVLGMHTTIAPHQPLTADELKRSAKLTRVDVESDERATLTFFSPKFVERRPIMVRVERNGEVSFVGVG